MSTATSVEQSEFYEDYRPLDRFYNDYEQYCIGLVDDPPAITELDESEHANARKLATFLDWKYEKGLEESVDRDMTTYEQVNDFLLRVEPEKFIAWLDRFVEDI